MFSFFSFCHLPSLGFWLLSGTVMVNANKVGPTSGSHYKVINLASQQLLAAMAFDLEIAKKLGRALIHCQLNCVCVKPKFNSTFLFSSEMFD